MLRYRFSPRLGRSAHHFALPWAGIGLIIILPTASSAATYIGSAGILAGTVVSKGTTDHPASYAVAIGGASASSSTSNAHGGTASAQANAGGYSPAAALGHIDYTFTISGDASYTYVPVRVQARGWAKGGGAVFEGYADLRVDGVTGNVIDKEIIADQGFYGPYSEFSVDQVVYLLSDTPTEVSMAATANGGQYGVYSGWAEAFVDPIFTIDPAYADRFKLVGIPQDTSADGVPEPAIWSLMVNGFGAIGATMRRRSTLRTDRQTLPC